MCWIMVNTSTDSPSKRVPAHKKKGLKQDLKEYEKFAKAKNTQIVLPGWWLRKLDHHVFIKYKIQHDTLPVPAVETLVQLSIHKHV